MSMCAQGCSSTNSSRKEPASIVPASRFGEVGEVGDRALRQRLVLGVEGRRQTSSPLASPAAEISAASSSSLEMTAA